MINYTIYDLKENITYKYKTNAKQFIKEWGITYEDLKELFYYGSFRIYNRDNEVKLIIMVNINNYAYRNLLKRELLDITVDEEIKKLIEEL